MRLIYLSPAFPPFTGGGERYVQALALTLARQGHAVTVITSAARKERDFWQPHAQPAGPVFEESGPLTIIRCPLLPFHWPFAGTLPDGHRRLRAWRKFMVLLSLLPGDQSRCLLPLARQIPPIAGLETVLARIGPVFDLVHAFNLSWEYPLAAGRQFAARHRLPYVITPFAHFGEVAGSGNWRARQVARNATMNHQRWLLEGADAVLTLTEAEEKGFAHWGIHPARVAVIGGGLDPVEEVAEPASVLARHRLQPPYALFVGRMTYDKGAIHAAAAARLLRRTGSPLTLALIGHQTPEFDAYLADLPDGERAAIRPLGILDEAEKHALLRAATMLLLPSRADSFGIVLLEAWFHGTPVIAARAGGIPGVVDDGKNGLLVPFGDVPALAGAVQRLLDDPALCRRLGQNGRGKVKETYTWDRVGQRVLDHYRALLAHERR